MRIVDLKLNVLPPKFKSFFDLYKTLIKEAESKRLLNDEFTTLIKFQYIDYAPFNTANSIPDKSDESIIYKVEIEILHLYREVTKELFDALPEFREQKEFYRFLSNIGGYDREQGKPRLRGLHIEKYIDLPIKD